MEALYHGRQLLLLDHSGTVSRAFKLHLAPSYFDSPLQELHERRRIPLCAPTSHRAEHILHGIQVRTVCIGPSTCLATKHRLT